ncbi:TRAP transporter small permease subunit [Allopusillimonas ginsengisoli]|uniref:TRAP transporter small permease subunit n=1 Tax=Allopusillimonas ginsengisoli TaxID=453575 RepID=UPI0039C0FF38
MRAIFIVMNGITRLNEIVGRLISLLVVFMSAFLLIEVFFRYVLSSPTVWANELTQFVFGFYAIMSGGYILAHRGHVNVDIFYSRFSPRTKAIVDIVTSALFFMFLAALLYFGSSMAYESISNLETSFSAWNAPVWPAKLAIPVGCVLLLLQGLVKLAHDICAALHPELPPLTSSGEQA